jgi:hypothetical protein
MGPNSITTYSDMEHISKELEYSWKLFLQNARWPVVINVIEHSKKKRLKAHFWVQILLNESLAYNL